MLILFSGLYFKGLKKKNFFKGLKKKEELPFQVFSLSVKPLQISHSEFENNIMCSAFYE